LCESSPVTADQYIYLIATTASLGPIDDYRLSIEEKRSLFELRFLISEAKRRPIRITFAAKLLRMSHPDDIDFEGLYWFKLPLVSEQ